jgi:uncharacterized delta-60 repeat protein
LACSGASAFGQGIPSANDGFDPNVTGSVYAIAVQTDGKLILGGNFSAVQPNGTVNPTPVNGLVRTNIDGSLDVVFPIAPNGTVAAQVNLAALQSNGDILVAGSFTTAQSGISNLARFTPQGTLDTTFKVVLGGAFGPNSAGITALAVQPDGKILIGGNFISVQGTGATAPVTRNHIARLNSDGSLDAAFNPNANAQVAAFALTPDGHILIGGAFTSLQPNGSTTALPLNHLALLNSDGSTNAVFDSSGNYVSGFNPNLNNLVSCIALQQDGKIIIAGAFSLIQANGATYPSSQQFIARLNPDGTYDASYQAGTPTSILAMVMQPNGQVVVGGNFTALQNGGSTNINVEHIGRINADGSTDLNYSPNANFTVSALAIQADGKVIAGGAFTQFHPAEAASPTYRNGVARLNIDGTVDSTFDPNAYGGIGVVVAAPNGQYLIGGSFSSVGGATATNLARLNANGTVDPTFDPAPNGPIATIAVQSNGQILVGGNFTTLGGITYYDANGNPIQNLVRLNPNGSVDTTFNPSPSGGVSIVVIQPNGQILVGGNFETILLPANSTLQQSPGFLVRLNGDGTPDTSFLPNPSASVNAILLEPSDNAIIIGGSFQGLTPSSTGVSTSANYLARISMTDASVDVNFNQVPDNPVTSLALQPNGQILVAGAFSNVIPGGQAIYTENTVTGVITNNLIPAAYVYRLNANGTLDTAFKPTPDDTVYSIVALPDQSIWIAGIFRHVGGVAQSYLARLNTTTGVLDPTFNYAVNGDVRWLLAQANNQVVAAGGFTTVTPLGGAPAIEYHIARFTDSTFPTLDTTFSTTSQLGASFRSIVVQPNGMIVLGGAFTNVTGVYSTNIARVFSDNTYDSNFLGDADGAVNSIALNPNGSLYVGGAFNGIGGSYSPYLARLNSDGSLDTTFVANPNGPVNAIVVQPNGQVIAGGTFAQVSYVVNSVATTAPRTNLARFNYIDGSADASFSPAFSGGAVNSLALTSQPGTGQVQILVGGAFISAAGVSQRALARLNSNGTLDPTFLPTINGTVNAIAVQSDGKVVIGGSFTTVDGAGRSNIARLNTDGSLDAAFNPGANGVVNSLVLQNNPNAPALSTIQAYPAAPPPSAASILVGGLFTSVAGGSAPYAARLNYDGSFDATFNPAPDNSVTAMAVQEDGKIILGGTFANVGGSPRSGLARLAAQGVTSNAIAIGRVTSGSPAITLGDSLTWTYGGRAPTVSSVLFQISPDDKNWTNLGNGTPTGTGSTNTWTLSNVPISSLISGDFFLRVVAVENTSEFGSSSQVAYDQEIYQLQPPIINSASNLTLGTTQAFFSQIAAVNSSSVPVYTTTGLPPFANTTTYSATGLPPGLSLSATTGIISGTAATAGTYPVTLMMTNAGGTSSTALLITVVAGNGGIAGTGVTRLTNISTNTQVTPAIPITDGFIISGTGPKTVLLRAIGPSLNALKVASPLDSTVLTLYDVAGNVILTNQGWGDTPTGPATTALMQIFARLGALAFTAGSQDSAAVTTLPPGAYTMRVSSGDGTTGTAVAEVWDADITPLTAMSHLSNLSANGQIYSGIPLTGGFVVSGPTATATMKLLVRGIGPSLVNFNIGSADPSPTLSLYTSANNSSPFAQNSGWGTPDTVNSAYPAAPVPTIITDSMTAGAFSLNAGTLDAVVEVTLTPGAYTGQITDASGTNGAALFELYSVPP